MKRKTKKHVLLVVTVLIVCLVAGAALAMVYRDKIRRTLDGADYAPEKERTTITRDGVTYKRDKSVRAYLFLGVDDVGLDYENYGRGGRTDTLLLFVKDGKELRILEISRDTMTEVDTYNPNGDYLSTGVMQINMQYSFGDSPRRSAYLTKKTVSKLLKGVEINGAVSLDMSGIAPVVDALGGIDVRMEEDCSYISPDYTLDAEVHMDGAAAEHFIRWRDKSSVGSNDVRMGRHAWFIRQMLQQGDEAEVDRLLKAAGDYVNTDMTVDEMKALYECGSVETIALPGESQRGVIHDEFYVDEDALEEVLIRLFYKPAG
jgi:LCP family protein required for cell wall assembly